MKRNPNQMLAAFTTPKEPLTAAFMEALFSCTFSTPGSNKNITEQRIYMYWTDFLQDCEGK
jgi:hypothetical protein